MTGTDRTQRAVDEATLARVITAGWNHVKQDGSPLGLARHILRSGVLLDADDGAALREHDDRTRVAELRELVRVLESNPPGALPYTPESLARLLTMRADRIEGREVDADADA